MHGTALIDERLQPLRAALLWCDARAARAAEAIVEQADFQRTIALAGNPPHSGFTAPQLRWLAEHDPDALARARWAVCAKDYVRAQLTDAVAADHSDASGTGLYGVAEQGWSARAGGARRGRRASAAAESSNRGMRRHRDGRRRAPHGASGRVPVAAGAADNAASAFGSGVTRPGRLIVSVGSPPARLAPVAAPAADPTAPATCSATPSPAAGPDGRRAQRRRRASAVAGGLHGAVDELAQAAAPPHPAATASSRCPTCRDGTCRATARARATVTGLTLAHGAGHVARALIEGAAYALADGLACLRAAGVEARRGARDRRARRAIASGRRR